MCDRCVDLGFAEVALPAGTHICQIYSDPEERDDALRRFLQAGLQANETCACFSDTIDKGAVYDYLADQGVDVERAERQQRLMVEDATSTYFAEGRFVPERMLGLLTAFHHGAQERGSAGARVIGEMSPDIGAVPGGSRLMEYESRVNLLLREHPVTAVCQYNAGLFDGSTIMEVLNVHPMMVVKGNVVMNPFFTPPEQYLHDHGL